MPTAHITPELFDYLKDLKRNNNRPWFQKNKQRYEQELKAPLLRFIEAAEKPLHRISRHVEVGPRCLFRIYRDTRFSKDKSPYKTNAGVHFRHRDGKSAHAPGLYIHLAPDEVFVGTGIWMPDSATLKKIRDMIVVDAKSWKRITSGKTFKKHCRLDGSVLKRPPRGYDPEHPFIEDLKRKDFVTITDFTRADACRADFMDRFIEVCRAANPFVAFLAEASGMEW